MLGPKLPGQVSLSERFADLAEEGDVGELRVFL
jgi:hypothetical protein